MEKDYRVNLTKEPESKPKEGQVIAEGVTKSNGTTVLFEDRKPKWADHPFHAKKGVLPWDK
jgi:hypothetical protein